jgi:hypothetical protein
MAWVARRTACVVLPKKCLQKFAMSKTPKTSPLREQGTLNDEEHEEIQCLERMLIRLQFGFGETKAQVLTIRAKSETNNSGPPT